ncbi:MAG: hypothetical protein HYR77_06165 [Ignavibacteria bacterium]|nr:hypothetical protein [Ignavibacteria bacterium]
MFISIVDIFVWSSFVFAGVMLCFLVYKLWKRFSNSKAPDDNDIDDY